MVEQRTLELSRHGFSERVGLSEKILMASVSNESSAVVYF